ncbi:hypothetical protein DFJ73DRAFT_490080 [Zopfochytrium polystomum]|nr:hypothetical protein DFJ73DRAFT_490080 [Zopfochytrium polystomum]
MTLPGSRPLSHRSSAPTLWIRKPPIDSRLSSHLHRTQTAALLPLRSRGGLRKTPLDFVRSVSLLDFFKQNLSRQAIGVLYSAEAMDSADSAEILQWWRDSGLETRYTEDAMILASGNGQIWNLQWWKDCGLPLKYSARAMSEASKMGWTHVLQWWKDSGLELKYDEAAITFASENGNVRVLQWWKDSGLPLEYDTEAAECATLNGHVEVLDWWLSSELELKCDHWRLPVGVPRCA